MRSITMASLKKVGTKLGETTKKSGFMRDIIEYFRQRPGQLISKNQIPEDLCKEPITLDNCFHHGYLLRGTHSGQEYYFIPALPEQELISLKNKFANLENFPDQKLRLIQQLIMEVGSSSEHALSTSDVTEISQNISADHEAVKQPMATKTLLQNNIAKYEEEIAKHEEEIKKLDNKIAATKQVVRDLKSILAQL